MTPNRYTELFFLDEAVALAAGHRPCMECQRQRARAFLTAWSRVSKTKPRAGLFDEQVHAQRTLGAYEVVQVALQPDGTFFDDDGAWLLWNGALHLWSHEGYGSPKQIDANMKLRRITPLSCVHALKNGFVPVVHSSLQSL